MEDRPNASKPNRRATVLPPFIAPRGTTPEGSPGQPRGEQPRPRNAQPFTPPGGSPARAATPVAPPSLPSPPPVTREESLFVVHEEPKRIELTITGEQRAVSSDDEFGVIEYDGAHRDLRAQTSEGELPEVDGLRLEHTEFSFDTATAPAEPLEVENFRAAEPFRTTYSEPATDASAQPTATDPEDVFAWDVARPAESDEQQPSARATPRSLAEIEDGVSWAPPAAEPVGIDARHAVADSLERVARRIRAGEIALSPDAHSGSDAAAIAAALTALLRMPG